MAREKATEDRRAIWKKTHPWVRFVEWARRRCKDTTSERWKIYREKGITCDLTAKQLETIWWRDNADKLFRPSLDRFPDSDGNYTMTNVRFIEFSRNSKIASDRRWGKEPDEQQQRETAEYIERLDSAERDCGTDFQVGGADVV